MSGKNQLPDLGKIFREDDDDGFLPSGGSRLASIFGSPTSKAPNNSAIQQQTLPVKKYGQNSAAQESKTEVIIAKAVHAFKLQNGQYATIGKLGIALAGNASTRSYQLILYRSKQEHISVVSITPDFSYTVQANNYSTYYDARKENWSILFENINECVEFAREVGLSRYFSRHEKSDHSLIYQDLNAPEKSVAAKEGDRLSVKCIISTEIVQPLKSNSTAELTMTVEISSDDNWERILLGSNTNLRRLLILPSSKQISLGPGYPKDRDIALEIEIIEIESSEAAEIKVPEVKPPVSSSKAAILSRMAKMGQSILPKTSISTTTDSEDTEDEVKNNRSARHKKTESTESGLSRKHVQSAQEPFDTSRNNLHKVTRSKHVLPSTHTSTVPNSQGSLIPVVYAPQWSPTQMQPQYVTVDGQAFPIAQQTIAQQIPAALDPSLNVFLAETRTQNTEIRMGMSKIADNIQKLLDKFHALELQNASSPSSEKTLENTLKMMLTVNASQMEAKNCPNLSTAKTNSNISEEVKENLMHNQLEETISAQEKDLKSLRENINSTKKGFAQLTEEKRNLEEVNLELKEKIKDLEILFKNKKQDFDNLISDKEKTEETVSDFQRRNSSLEREISQLKTDYEALESATSTKQKMVNSDITIQVLKNEDTEEEFSESNVETVKKVKPDDASKLSVSNDNLENREDQTKSEWQTQNRNRSTLVQIAPGFESEPPPIPPMDSSNENEWSDN
ncbi:FK506-binding protein 15 isoform X2 [Belonocnema kinseyi]|uniref:FK506-binding protein 15 isoform X2 n=1 Tax=Belonocnema kinseyi TaxID=2817044 RepID=UPI00143CEE30|nr:FK506-binding protein 15 isoform X2 [Belonocnema kinseyi]